MNPAKPRPARATPSERDYEGFGRYLAGRRVAAGFTQRRVAATLGYSSAQFISNFERGIAVPPLKKLKVLLKLYKMPMATVLDLILDCERTRIAAVLTPAPGKRRA
jgi:transcriptional regulator with XRE-family HTH domain